MGIQSFWVPMATRSIWLRWGLLILSRQGFFIPDVPEQDPIGVITRVPPGRSWARKVQVRATRQSMPTSEQTGSGHPDSTRPLQQACSYSTCNSNPNGWNSSPGVLLNLGLGFSRCLFSVDSLEKPAFGVSWGYWADLAIWTGLNSAGRGYCESGPNRPCDCTLYELLHIVFTICFNLEQWFVNWFGDSGVSLLPW